MRLPFDLPDFPATLLDAIERAGLGLTIVRLESGVLTRLYTNRCFCELSGYTADELIAIAPTALTPPADRDRLIALHAEFQRTGRFPPTLESALVHRDGTLIPVEVSLANVPLGGGSATVSFVRDLRDRRRVEAALRESEAWFRSLAEASPDSIVVIHAGRIVYANPATARVLGFDTAEEFMARPLDQLLLDPEETAIMGERMGRIARGERLPPREYTGRRRDGTPAVMEISATPVTYDGKPAVLALGRDTSERRAWHAELLRTDRLASLGLLAASVAHEVNNPLTYMMLHLERLSAMVGAAITEPGQRKRAVEMIAAAREGGDRVRTIVGELLDVARHDHQAAPVAVEAALDAALRLAGPTLGERAEVVRRGGPTPLVLANVGRLSQVFLNLLVNAADAFDRPDGANVVEVIVGHDDREVTVAVRDNGRGIARAELDRIFEPLFTTKARGTGLGLSICKSIVTELGGAIEATSQLGAGTTITVRLPIAAAAGVADEAPAGPRRRVAIIDDDVLLAHSFAALVSPRHDVEVFTAPRAALAALVDGALFDHVLCDVNMPGLSGIDLYAELCVRRPPYATRFTMITGGAPSPRLEAMVASGAVRLLLKPFDVAALMAELVPGAGLEPA